MRDPDLERRVEEPARPRPTDLPPRPSPGLAAAAPRGVGSAYGREGRTTPASIAVDRGRRVVIVDLKSLSWFSVSPAACRGREIRGPVLDALGQYDPRWSVRFTVRGDPKAFSRYLNRS